MPDAPAMPLITVFISYSRADTEFADRLAEALESSDNTNVKVLIDRRDLPYGERWWDMLIDFMQRCDRVLFLVSADSVKSGWCQKEVDEIRRIGRRLIPIVVRETPLADIPADIKAIQLLPFTPPAAFEAQVAKLVTALYQNVEWNRHRRVLDTLAEHWSEQLRPRSLLLGAEQVQRFTSWMAERPPIEPPMSQVSDAFLDFSGFHSSREQHFTELRSLRETAASGWMKWLALATGFLVCVGGLSLLVNAALTEFAWRIAGWASSVLACTGISVPIGRSIGRSNAAATARAGEKEDYIKRYDELGDAETFIATKAKEEAEQKQRQKDSDELEQLRKFKKEQEQEKKAGSKPASQPPNRGDASKGMAQSAGDPKKTSFEPEPTQISAPVASTPATPTAKDPLP